MRYGVTFYQSVLGGGDSGGAYTVFSPVKNQYMKYAKGKPAYELVDPDGNVYALQARKDDVPESSLATLGDQMTQLPAGWSYRTRVLTEDVEINMTPDKQNPSVTDEFDQTYVQEPASSATVPTKMPTTGFGPADEGGPGVNLLLATMTLLGLLALGAAVYEHRRASTKAKSSDS